MEVECFEEVFDGSLTEGAKGSEQPKHGDAGWYTGRRQAALDQFDKLLRDFAGNGEAKRSNDGRRAKSHKQTDNVRCKAFEVLDVILRIAL